MKDGGEVSWPRLSLYLPRLRVDHAHDVLPILRASVVVAGPAAGAAGVFARVVSLATPQAQVHVADAPPELTVPGAVTALGLLLAASRRHPAAPPAYACRRAQDRSAGGSTVENLHLAQP